MFRVEQTQEANAYICTALKPNDIVGTVNLPWVIFSTDHAPAGLSGTLQYNNAENFGSITNWSTNGTSEIKGSDTSLLVLGDDSDFAMRHTGTLLRLINTTGAFEITNTSLTDPIANVLGN